MIIQVWDKSIRIFHWLLVLSVTTAVVTSFFEEMLTLHILSGIFLVSLTVFRIGWGFLGNEYARFGSFIKGPSYFFSHARDLIKQKTERHLGHNPVAAWMFVGMFLVVSVLLISGFILVSGQEKLGALAGVVSQDFASNFAAPHKWIGYLLVIMAIAHVIGVLLESLHQKENLIGAMIHGKKRTKQTTPAAPVEISHSRHKILTLVVYGSLINFYLFWPLTYGLLETQIATKNELRVAENTQYQEAHPEKEFAPLVSEVMLFGTKEFDVTAFNLYKEECGSCHFEFSANLLPKRSWLKMMAELEEHFDDDASLEEEETATLTGYLLANSAEVSKSEAAYYIGKDIPETQAPLRFSKTYYWEEKHQDIHPSVFKREKVRNKLNCGACHEYALYGSFEDAHIAIPK